MQILAACGKCGTQYDVSGLRAGSSAHCRCGVALVVAHPRVHEARLTRCAGCGSTRGGGGDNCNYCGARFSAVDKGWGSMCPGCFCRLPVGACFCVECGLKISPQKLGAARPDLNCPRCKSMLHQRALDGIDMSECGACAGVWLPVSTFTALIEQKQKRDTAIRGLSSRRNRRNAFEMTESEEVKYVPCPKCRTLMNRGNFARVSGVVIDTCRDCGVWLDNQELNRIVQFVEAGGMDKSREAEARDREHSEKMRAKTKKTGVMLLPTETPGRYSVLPPGGTSPADVILPALVRAISEIARAFLR
jgi:Zn-finger nucleic acid-binding protein